MSTMWGLIPSHSVPGLIHAGNHGLYGCTKIKDKKPWCFFPVNQFRGEHQNHIQQFKNIQLLNILRIIKMHPKLISTYFNTHVKIVKAGSRAWWVFPSLRRALGSTAAMRGVWPTGTVVLEQVQQKKVEVQRCSNLICVFLRLLISYRTYLQMVNQHISHRSSQRISTILHQQVWLCQYGIPIFRVYHSIFPSKNEHSSKSLWHSININSWFAGIPQLDPNPSGLINPQLIVT